MKKKLITQSDDLIAQGVAKKLIRIGDDGKRIEYLLHGISRDWTKPDGKLSEIVVSPLEFDDYEPSWQRERPGHWRR